MRGRTRRWATVSAVLLLPGLTATSAAAAQAGAVAGLAGSPDVTVTAGQALQQKSGDYGAGEIDQLTRDLAHDVGQAVARSRRPGAPVQVQLTLEDATPNRPTAAELGRSSGLSLERSIGLGGAWIDGSATLADGRKVSLGYSFYETNLRNENGPTTWSDARRAFEMLAQRLARGDYPQQASPSPTPNNGFAHFPG